MEIIRLAGSYGGSVYETVVERFGQGVTVKRALFVPKSARYTKRIDVTAEFNELLSKTGGISIVDTQITLETLRKKPPSQRKFWGLLTREEVVCTLDDRESQATPGWLCIFFAIPGGSNYMCYYDTTVENVTFPPTGIVYNTMVPLHKQIVSCSLAVKGSKESDDDMEDLFDLTDLVTQMAGPDGTFFGRESVDLGLAINACLESGAIDIDSLLDFALSTKLELILFYADGVSAHIHKINNHTPNTKII